MMDTPLQHRLRQVHRRQQAVWLARDLAAVWLGAAALAGLCWLVLSSVGGATSLIVPIIGALAVAAAIGVTVRRSVLPVDYRQMAEQVERGCPELNGLVLTAVQVAPAPDGSIGFLEQRLVDAAVERSKERDWRTLVPTGRLVAAHLGQLAAMAVLVAAIVQFHRWQARPIEQRERLLQGGVAVSPGDAEIERGERLVVLARFGDQVPSQAALIVQEANVPVRRIPLVKSLADPVFGGTVPSVDAPLTYRIDYDGVLTREFRVSVFEYPRLERADAQLTYPAYTQLETKRIEDTRRLSAVEGTRLGLTLQLNKPVASARLVARDKAKTALPLTVSPERAVVELPAMELAATQTYDLELRDAEGRANRQPTPFVIEVQPNRRPELRLASPRGDVRPSALEEVTFEATVWDDFGVLRYGLTFNRVGQPPQEIEIGTAVPAREKRSFRHVMSLEGLGVKADDLMSWHLWAEDLGPDGRARRTETDLYFAEVRPFDEIFREDSSQQAQDQDGDQAGGAQAGARRLVELQKQVISATWKLQRDPTAKGYASDVNVVRDSQVQAIDMGREAVGQMPTRLQPVMNGALKFMEEAAARLNAAGEAPGELAPALVAEQAAYQALLQMQLRETSVARSRNRRGGQGGESGNQRQLDQLDLDQSENRYETQRQAKAPANPGRREQLQAQNRLQELARRQHDVNERLKELQTALQEARTEQQREEVRRELKRLQEEQREMLADLDALHQRMDQPENQSQMSDERRQLEQAREDLQRAAEATGQGTVAQALAAGTRAQRQLQELRESMRKENAGEFVEELRDLRGEARELARQQQQIGERLNGMNDSRRKSLSEDPEKKALADALTSQQQRMQTLMERATQVSQQAETSEPLLSRRLYESLRKVSQDDANAAKQVQQEMLDAGTMTRGLYERLKKDDGKEGGQAFELASELLQEGLLPQAASAERRARAGVDELRRGVERAAESVLGDDAEALRHAQSELQTLTDQLSQEAQRAAAAGERDPSRPPGSTEGRGDGERADPAPGAASSQEASEAVRLAQGEAARGERSAQNRGATPGGAQPGQANPTDPAREPASPDQPGQPGQDGSSGAPGGRSPTSALTQAGGRAEMERWLNQLTESTAEGSLGGIGRPEASGGIWNGGPIFGGDFGRWSERLRDVEEVLDSSDLRNAVAEARERARLMRQEFRREQKKPDWAVVRLEVLKPLVEVQARIGEELARRETDNPLAPVDRDPVPPRFAESVRRYYEELGKDR